MYAARGVLLPLLLSDVQDALPCRTGRDKQQEGSQHRHSSSSGKPHAQHLRSPFSAPPVRSDDSELSLLDSSTGVPVPVSCKTVCLLFWQC